MLKNQESDGGVDIISNLPDPILCKILNYLSTKNAVATNVLSTRWKYLFPFEAAAPLYLTFDDTDFILRPVQNEPHCIASFESFVDKMLCQTLSYNPPVRAMHLYCHRFHGDANIESWINAALRLNFRKLYLLFSPRQDPEILFTCLNGYTKLVRLDLCFTAILLLPDNFTLPSLKELELTRLWFNYDGGDSINKLLDGCPMLEGLSLIDCVFFWNEDISIRSTLLRHLTMKDSAKHAKYDLELDTPNLQSLHLCCFAARKYSLSSFKYLLKAHIDIGPKKDEVLKDIEGYANVYPDGDENTWFTDMGTAKLLTACSSTFGLEMPARAIDAVHNSAVQMPLFHNLTGLWLGSLGSHGWALLARLLLNAPVLREVYFEEVFNCNEGGYEDFKSLVPTPPTCLKTHMRKIEFLVFHGCDDEVKLLLYFLLNCKLLEKVRLCVYPSFSQIGALKLYPQVVVESRD